MTKKNSLSGEIDPYGDFANVGHFLTTIDQILQIYNYICEHICLCIQSVSDPILTVCGIFFIKLGGFKGYVNN